MWAGSTADAAAAPLSESSNVRQDLQSDKKKVLTLPELSGGARGAGRKGGRGVRGGAVAPGGHLQGGDGTLTRLSNFFNARL